MMHKIFFALYPDEAVAADMERLARLLRRGLGLSGSLLAAERLHVTLHVLGMYDDVPRELVAILAAAAAGVSVAPFDVEFDRVRSFRRHTGNRPLVMQGSDGLADLLAFHKTLDAALAKAGIGRGTRSSFTPHVTLMYTDQDVEDQAVKAMRWTVRDFVLVDSLQGAGRHEELGRWPLRAVASWPPARL